MKKLFTLITVLLFFLALVTGCQKKSPVTPDQKEGNTTTSLEKAEVIALELIEQSEWELDPQEKMSDGKEASLEKVTCRWFRDFERHVISGNIVHYKILVQIGPGAYDVIAIHRVVKERRPFKPIRSKKNIFLQHGDCKNFEQMFLQSIFSPGTPDDYCVAVFLAQNNVDVWGISQAWSLVPAEENEHSFMAGWGLQKQVDDLRHIYGIR